ncbi:MAG: TPM domain-containing protein [Desulfohalobiaceae bacterium]
MPRLDPTSQGMRMAKPAALALVLALVVLLFWFNFDYSLQQIQPEGNIRDQTGRLSPEQKEHLQDFSAALEEHFGLEFQLRVRAGELEAEQAGPRTMLLVLDPEQEKWLLRLPTLLEKALPGDFVRYIQKEHFRPYLQQGNWPQGLMDFAHQFWEQLQGMQDMEEHDS